MTRDEIIALAVEAGFNWPEVQTTTIEQRLERFYALAVAKETQSRQASQLELEQFRNEAQRRAAVLIKESYQRGVRDEREACAKFFEEMDHPGVVVATKEHIAAAIRSRGSQ